MSIHNKLKILVVCSRNRLRSPTAENMYRGDPRVEIHSAGISQKAIHHISAKDVNWAEIILCMEIKQKKYIQKTFNKVKLPNIKVLNIPDEYEYMSPELIEFLKNDIEEILV